MLYDDGDVQVPSGSARPVERVVVVGAGIAGLTVANALAQAGVECVVLEARERIGGRLHTVDLGGVPVDLGGSWIHQPVGNPLRDLADDLGIDCRPGDSIPTLGGYDCAERRRLSRAEVESILDVQFGAFPDAAEALRAQLGPAASGAQAIDEFVRCADLAPADERRTRQALLAEVEAVAADRANRQSLQWLWDEKEYGGAYLGDLPDGGYGTLVAALARGLDIRLGRAVVEVTATSAGVRVHCSDDEMHEGSHVVVAVPLGVLKRGVPRFSPTLSPARAATIERLGFGRYEKVCLAFSEPFWRASGLSHQVFFGADAGEAAAWMFDHDAVGTGPALTFHVFPSLTARVLAGGSQGAVRWATDLLTDVTGAPCPEPSAFAVTSWAQDPWTGGAYTHVPPGAEPLDLDRLGEPEGDRILFAGEHTQSARIGYADGAMASGVREAKRLLGQPRVRLGRLS